VGADVLLTGRGRRPGRERRRGERDAGCASLPSGALARTHYAKLQVPVAHFVRRKLGRAAENLPDQELEASYNVAWDALMRQVAQDRAPDSIDGWLRVVTFRQALGYLRRRRFHCELPLGEHDDFETAGDPWELANSREIVRH
jgi:DNA-directed RNA polymerase specialized sigma24 family protein